MMSIARDGHASSNDCKEHYDHKNEKHAWIKKICPTHRLWIIYIYPNITRKALKLFRFKLL